MGVLFAIAALMALALAGGLALYAIIEDPGSNSYALLAEAFLNGRLDTTTCFDGDCARFEDKIFVMFPPVPAIIALPFVVLVVQARLVGIRKDYEEAALSLGANPMQTFFQITLPLLMPAVFAGALFAFTISFDNITATVFWRPAGSETVPTQIFGMLRNSVSPEINALGFVMIVVTVGVPLMAGGLARYFTRKKR